MAKKRKLVTRRRLKWVGLAVTSFGLAMAVASFWLVAGWIDRKPNREIGVHVANACVWFTLADFDLPLASYPDGLHVFVHDEPSVVLLPKWPTRHTYGLPGGMGTDVRGHLPLWLPLLLIAAPTAWLWRTDRRAKPWQCVNCRYDLRGLASDSQTTTCPECGTKVDLRQNPTNG